MLLEDLKRETHAQHLALEKLNSLPATHAEYIEWLEMYYGYVAAWESAVARVLPAEDPIRLGREKAAWLRADLGYLGRSETAIASLPLCGELPPLRTRPQVLGSAYVLEGSTLGGQFIARHLDQQLGLGQAAGCSYFRSYGPQVGSMWQAFRAELQRGSSPETDPVILSSARATFASLQAWFSARRVAA